MLSKGNAPEPSTNFTIMKGGKLSLRDSRYRPLFCCFKKYKEATSWKDESDVTRDGKEDVKAFIAAPGRPPTSTTAASNIERARRMLCGRSPSLENAIAEEFEDISGSVSNIIHNYFQKVSLFIRPVGIKAQLKQNGASQEKFSACAEIIQENFELINLKNNGHLSYVTMPLVTLPQNMTSGVDHLKLLAESEICRALK
ncbi:hypothetical protein AVEN_25451-1 [Araneus ventricosus]|uniref:Uncharacterized protein n=1 Tax=Araneus ventricosus TaxID=182803 RepID=A0A4Y2QTM8_ARAVE|nr:hypothetical protein AVEN_25451-1 [Araneus ventricosus]